MQLTSIVSLDLTLLRVGAFQPSKYVVVIVVAHTLRLREQCLAHSREQGETSCRLTALQNGKQISSVNPFSRPKEECE